MIIMRFISKRLDLSENKERIMNNLFWSVLGKIVTMLGSFLVGIIIARYLGAKDYGMMNYVISYVMLFQILSSFGLDHIEIREEAKNDVPANIIMGTSFRIRIVLSVITIMLTVGTSFVYESDFHTVLYVAIYSLSVIARSFDVIRNRFTSLVQNEYVVKSEIYRTVVGVIIKVGLLLVNASLVWFIAATAFDFVLLSSGYVFAYNRKIGKLRDWKYSSEYARYLFKEAFPLLLTSAAVFIYQRIDQVMIGNMIDKVNVSYFATASRFVEILIFVPTMIVQTVTPVLVGIRKTSENDYKAKAQQFMNITFWLTMLLSVLLALSSYVLVKYTFGSEYLAAAPVLSILAFKTVAFSLSTTAGAMLVIEGLQKFAIIRDLFGCVVCIGLNYLLLPLYGIEAAAFVAVVSYFCAGYVADLFVPKYRHLFQMQTKTVFLGWKDLINIKSLLKR